MVPESVLQDFLQRAREDLESLQLSTANPPLPSPAAIRSLLLERQRAVLESVVADYNNGQKDKTSSPFLTTEAVQAALKTIDHSAPDTPATHTKGESSTPALGALVRDLNETARVTFARCVLYVASHRTTQQTLQQKMALQAEGTMERKALLDFMALCQTVVRLPCVKQHLGKGTPLFEDLEAPLEPNQSDAELPQQRLEEIQHLLLNELGYDAAFGSQEIKRIFFSGHENEFTGDAQVAETFAQTMAALNAAVTAANIQVSRFSDLDQGGVTRVVAVDYSEKVVDHNGNVVSMQGATQQTMAEHVEQEQRQTLHMASQAAALQQKMLNELQAMPTEDRQQLLDEAAQMSQDVMRRVMACPPGPERIQVLRSVDERTQRLMAMHKLWQAFGASQKGQKAHDIKSPE